MKLEVLSIVFVDIKGYTSKTSNQSRLFNERLLGRFTALVKPMVRIFDGTVIKSLGDAYLLTFKSPTDSLLCAMAVLDELANRSGHWPEEERFELRFAINAGEVRLEKGDVFGEAVNVAARIEGLAEGGEIYFSEAVYLIMNRNEVPARELGLKKLKGVAEDVRVYRVPRKDQAPTAVPFQAAEATAPEWALALPFGGLGLSKVRTHATGRAVDAEGSLRFSGALSEAHYGAATWARSLSSRGLWAKPLVLFFYPLSFLLLLGGLALSWRAWKGLWMRVRRTLHLLKESPSYRRKAMGAALTTAAVLGIAWWSWHQYVSAQQAQEEARLLQERAEALKEQMAKKEQELKKERNRFKFPWQRKD